MPTMFFHLQAAKLGSTFNHPDWESSDPANPVGIKNIPSLKMNEKARPTNVRHKQGNSNQC